MQESHQDLEKLRKELRMTRIFSAVTSILLICVLIGGYIVFSKMQEYIEEVMPLVEKMSAQLEQFESFTKSIKDFFSKLGGGINFGDL